MTDTSRQPRPPTRSRIGPALAIAIAAFLIGLGLMAYAVRNTPGFFVRGASSGTPAARPTAAPAPAAVPSDADTAALALREATLAAQLANLEARAARTDADTADAAVSAGKAEAILVTFAARRALDRGAGLGYLENELRRRFGATLPQQVATVIRAARQPVTLEDLRESLNTAAPMLLATPSDWWSGIGAELRNLVVIHRADTPSPLPSDRLARARRQIDNGNVQTALAEVERLPGAADATNWTAAARRWIDARAALDTLETAAITGAFAPPPARPAEPASAPTPTAPTGAGLF